MRKIVDEIEYRQYIGLDKRSDRSLVPRNYQTVNKNTVIKRGVYETRAGYSKVGSIDDTALSGNVFRRIAVDVGDDTYILLHKGTSLFFGKLTDSTYTQIQDVQVVPVNIVVTAEESEFEVRGKEVGSTGKLSLKVMHKTATKVTLLEWDDVIWKGRDTGIENDMTFVAVATSGGSAPIGFYRMRLVAIREINGIRTNESAPTAEDGTTPADRDYQTVEFTATAQTLSVTITHTSPDSQITHYMLQITQNLIFSGDSEFTTNGHDPTLYFETTVILSATALAGAVIIDIGNESLDVVAPNLVGFLPIPGHLISQRSGGILFFAGIGEFRNRIFKSGISGFYYHNEMYDPFEFFAAGEDDGEALIGLGLVQDHLLILKEGKTGIVPNHDINGSIVWRDRKLGCLNRKAFANISEDQVIVLNEDGIFRVFDGIRYDRSQEIDGQGYPFSENIRNASEAIDPSTLEFLYHEERLHIIFGVAGEREALVLHPRDFLAWTEWDELFHFNNMLIDNGNRWIFDKGPGRLFEQNEDTPSKTDDGEIINWEIRYAALHSQISRKNKTLIKVIGIEGDYDNSVFDEVITDDGRTTTGQQSVFPDPATNPNLPWYQCHLGLSQVVGNFHELIIRGTGAMTTRGVYWSFIEKRSGNLGWTLPILARKTPVDVDALIIDAGADTDDRTLFDIFDAREDTVDRSSFPIYERA